MNTQLSELLRLLTNLIRIGTISEVDTENGLCRVQTGGLETTPLKWLTMRAGSARTWWAPSIGEQVLILSMAGELTTAFVLPAIFSDAHPAPSDSEGALVAEFPDGARFSYDPEASALTVEGVKTAIFKATTGIRLETPKVTCTQLLETAQLSVTDGGTMTGDITHSGGQLTSNGVVVDEHMHSGVETGGGTSGGPVK
ncbi:phage baseplate assembly protein V [Serratia quinivorans]|uniref:phage baseplate assembly protein V n=1 Tax=Serratia quinivorans TaxID=137545 RepID=UPI0021777866|nr:phage baseplate assembly protein V [Serratia quinivorans]CAI0766449.1 Phage P2 baseplate assembly protein gpV [Serratia quinivorans]CAI2049664.1 Phage P2 baseplate assembly protein gpV [Serratia quinivorans]